MYPIIGNKINYCGTETQFLDQSLNDKEEKIQLNQFQKLKIQTIQRIKKEYEYSLNEATIGEDEFNEIIAKIIKP